MVLEHTLLDDPKTPAYKFAYRAFRGILYGSPGTSPIKPPPHHTQHDNKENEIINFLDHASNLNTKRKSPAHKNDNTTPKRQRTLAVSPTKSILRNPNLPTPRRGSARELTVTFKDIGKSVSPELLYQTSPTKPRPSAYRPTSSRESLTDATKDATSVSQTHNHSQERSGARDLDGYIAQTEKEMKKLIKYGQKMRDIAKTHKAENKRLKAQMEAMEKENQRLQRRLALHEREIEVESMKAREEEEDQPSFEVVRESDVRTFGKTQPVPMQNCQRDKTAVDSRKGSEYIPRKLRDSDREHDLPTVESPLARMASLSIHKEPPNPALLCTLTKKDQEAVRLKSTILTKSSVEPQPAKKPISEPTIEDHAAQNDVRIQENAPSTAGSSEAEARRIAARQRLALKRSARAASLPAVVPTASTKQGRPSAVVTTTAKVEDSMNDFDPWLDA